VPHCLLNFLQKILKYFGEGALALLVKAWKYSKEVNRTYLDAQRDKHVD